MSMLSINTNMMARDASRQLSAHYAALSDSVRRISSGLRVEEAADDAAGLAIRELMRADVEALGQGARNANDAISLIQTADGALAVIDEKLIRMKELAEQASTGTYDSTQRALINNEYLEMAYEIERIAHSTEFNGIKLLDGSLSGEHDGSGAGSADGLSSTGELKVHFGTANDSAEDYYYINIGDCTLAGLGLATGVPDIDTNALDSAGGVITFADGSTYTVNDWDGNLEWAWYLNPLGLQPFTYTPPGRPLDVQERNWTDEWFWGSGTWTGFGFIAVIPQGTKNFVFNLAMGSAEAGEGARQDADIQLFTMSGVHLAGTPPATDESYTITNDNAAWFGRPTNVSDINSYSPWLGFTEADYDGTNLNSGPANYNNGNTGAVDNTSLNWSTYNGMNIGYSGDANTANDAIVQTKPGYETLVIDGEVTEDLVIWVNGPRDIIYKMYWDGGPGRPEDVDAMMEKYGGIMAFNQTAGAIWTIETQDKAQLALNRLDEAIVRKDTVRAHLGALQNRLENTVSNITIQAENLLNAESRISDVDVASEMTTFVRNQVLTQSATAMLSQANAFPHMLMQLLQG